MTTDRTTSVLVAGARTPMGRLLGSLSGFSGSDLGGFAIKGALERAGISGDQVDYVIMGQVIQAGAGQNPARTAAVAGGIPMTVPSITINKVCLSGINAIALADQSGDYDGYVAIGVVIRGETYHFEIVAGESARGIMALTMDGVAIGNGILTVENEAQALVRADPAQKDKGGEAAKAAMALLALRERWGN